MTTPNNKSWEEFEGNIDFIVGANSPSLYPGYSDHEYMATINEIKELFYKFLEQERKDERQRVLSEVFEMVEDNINEDETDKFRESEDFTIKWKNDHLFQLAFNKAHLTILTKLNQLKEE